VGTLGTLAQTNSIGFENYSIDQGLSHGSVYCVSQDRYGFLWVGTKEGLNRFDGYGFYSFEYSAADKNSISGSSVFSMSFGSNEKLWIATNEGLSVFDPRILQAKRIPYGKTDGTGILGRNCWNLFLSRSKKLWISTDKGVEFWDPSTSKFGRLLADGIWKKRVNCIVEDLNSKLWIATWGSGLQIYDPKTKNVQTITHETNPNFRDLNVNSIMVDSKQNMWICGEHYLYKIAANTQTITRFGQDTPMKFKSENPSCVFEDSYGTIWVGTLGNGLARFTDDKGFEFFTKDASDPYSLADNFVNHFYEDSEGALWVATGNGISRFDRNRKKINTIRSDENNPQSLNSNIINHILEDSKGRIWIATKENGINMQLPGNTNYTHYTNEANNPHSLMSDRVNVLCEDTLGNIWAATSIGVSCLNPTTGKFTNYERNLEKRSWLSASYVQTIFCDKSGQIWVGTVNGLDRFIGNNPPYFENIPLLGGKEGFLINNITQDRSQVLWLGTFGKGLVRYNPTTKESKSYQHDSKSIKSISNNHIYYLYIDTDNSIWVGTNGTGLDHFDSRSETFSHITEKDGLPNNVINGILDDQNGALWLSSNKGLSCYNKQTGAIDNYDAEYGLQSNQFRRRACERTRDGKMYFGGIDGLNTFYTSDIHKNPNAPLVNIMGVEITSITGSIHAISLLGSKDTTLYFGYKQNSFIFNFIGISYTMSRKNTYSYKLEGFDKNWKKAGTRLFAEYTNIPPGTYTFRVKAANNDGVWNETGANLQIYIAAPIWLRWWAIILELLALFGLIVLFIYARTQNFKHQNLILEQRVSDRTSELEQSREELLAQRDELEVQTVALADQSKQIRDSIIYAERIQRALLNSGDLIDKQLKEHFTLFKPKDIVSGDFYWACQLGNRLAIAAADCTGHGVPGAFLSMLGIAFLNEITAQSDAITSGELLTKLRKKVKKIFRTTQAKFISDGIDISLCIIDPEAKQIQFSGAYNPLIYIRENELYTIKGDPMPIGYYIRETPDFSTTILDVQANDAFYLFTDGYLDQFGGPNGNKLMIRNFRELLLDIHTLPMQKQLDILDKHILQYKGSQIQIDDILVMGFRVF
jgi:ligand-binding sensor domain-containing protein/serine phosphatase RsbU (regulator of sigma subunit)